MDGVGSYTTSWRVVSIDPRSWQGTETVPNVNSIKISNKATDEIPKIQSGSLSVVLPAGERFPAGWYRIEMVAVDGAGSARRMDLATLLFEQASGTSDYGVETVAVNGQSVLSPVEGKHMPFGSYIDKFSNGAEWCVNALRAATPAPVVLDDPDGFIVDRYYVFDDNTSTLKAVWKILDSAGWVLQIDGDGTIRVKKKPVDFSVEFGRENLRYIKPTISYDEDYSDVPNVYYARLGDVSAQAVNDDPSSPVSTVSRMYEKDVRDSDPVPIDGESLDHYVNRMLEEKSTIYKTYDYERVSLFDLKVFDNVYWNIPNVKTGVMRVLSQSIKCDKGVSIEEQCGEEINLWRMTR